MNNINWNEFYIRKTIAERRTYLRSIFNDSEKKINKTFFVVNPIGVEEGLSFARRKKRQSVNFLKNLMRHIVLPSPITWSHRHSDRLVKKAVFSMEDYMMGDFRFKDHISSLRTGAPQYRGILIGGASLLAGLAAGGTFASLGLLPLLGFGALGVYLSYAAYRASRKSKIQVALLKTRMSTFKETNKGEQLFARLYQFVTVMEGQKKSIQRDDLLTAKSKLRTTLHNELSELFNDDKGLTKELNKLVKDHVNSFLMDIDITIPGNPRYIGNRNSLLNRLEVLVTAMESIEVQKELEILETESLVKNMMTKLKENMAENAHKVRVYTSLIEHGSIRRWTKNSYIREMQQSNVDAETQSFFIDTMGGDSSIGALMAKPVLNTGKSVSNRRKPKRKTAVGSKRLIEKNQGEKPKRKRAASKKTATIDMVEPFDPFYMEQLSVSPKQESKASPSSENIRKKGNKSVLRRTDSGKISL